MANTKRIKQNVTSKKPQVAIRFVFGKLGVQNLTTNQVYNRCMQFQKDY